MALECPCTVPCYSVLDLNCLIVQRRRNLFYIKRERNRIDSIAMTLERLCIVPCRSVLDFDGLVF